MLLGQPSPDIMCQLLEQCSENYCYREATFLLIGEICFLWLLQPASGLCNIKDEMYSEGKTSVAYGFLGLMKLNGYTNCHILWNVQAWNYN
ncbi:hypothetical protein F0562_028742 [Nyssa sinensis]|uniref:Uncharacterized protein n=1 Tax=Nyssa sinensis TaxID=561372 RepID=A0A5J5B0Y1_9ASTE|nr:hypothetical protein F0562_028742 [Nyssa sinensis]